MTSAAPVPPKRRYGADVDLPIAVADEAERLLHNDARRFARLLVSEIKLYKERQVVEGRAQRDLYVRLREDIDRSREMYEKRVRPEVAQKFDYFHHELVNTLAEGDVAKLGSGYPGATVSRLNFNVDRFQSEILKLRIALKGTAGFIEPVQGISTSKSYCPQ